MPCAVPLGRPAPTWRRSWTRPCIPQGWGDRLIWTDQIAAPGPVATRADKILPANARRGRSAVQLGDAVANAEPTSATAADLPTHDLDQPPLQYQAEPGGVPGRVRGLSSPRH